MSVDTHLKGKNLQPYRVLRQDGVKIHVAPNLIGFASRVQLDVKSGLRKRIDVDIHHEHGPACSH